MNRAEFMRELERLLQNIPESERVEALAYYEEYFDDAGPENEQQVIAELGYPGKVADTIKEGLRGNMGYQNYGSGYQNTGYQQIGTQNVYTGTAQPAQEEGLPTWAITLIVIGCIIASPALIGLAGTLIGAIFTVIGTLIGIIVGFGAGGIALLVAAVVCLALGISLIPTNGFVGALVSGVSLLLAAIGLLLILATVWICGWALPGFIKWVIRLCKMPFQKKNGGAAA